MLKNGFRAYGLCPFDPNLIDYSKLSFKLTMKTLGSSVSIEKHEEHLKIFEELSSLKLVKFKKSGSAWDGAIEDSSLFCYWLNLRNKIANLRMELDQNGQDLDTNYFTQGEVTEGIDVYTGIVN